MNCERKILEQELELYAAKELCGKQFLIDIIATIFRLRM
jgi:hypothetical protein